MAEPDSIIPTCMRATPSPPRPAEYGRGDQANTIQYDLSDEVHLKTEDDILSFANLMTSSSSSSSSSLHALRISVGKVGPAAAVALVSLLSKLTTEPSARLISLELDDDAEDLLASSPGLPGAFAGLTTLKTVRIASVGMLGADMLLNMKSSLVAAELCLDAIRGDDDEPPLEERCCSNPVFLLQGSQSTLETLKASWALTDDNESFGIYYPAVRELALDFLDVPLTYDYVCAFPNLANLSVSSIRFVGDRGISEATRYRNANKRDQEEYGTWDALDAVICTLLDAYLLALQCPSVSTLRLSLDGTGQSQECSSHMLHTVLNDAQPTVLQLTVGSPRILLKPSLLSALRVERTRLLETLAITYEVEVRDTCSIVREALKCILHELVPVRITTFELEIDCTKIYAEELPGPADFWEDTHSAGGYLYAFSLRDLAEELTASIDTAPSVRVSLRGHKFRRDLSVIRGPGSEDWGSGGVYSEEVSSDDDRDDGRVEESEEEYVVGHASSQQEVEKMLIVQDSTDSE